MPGHGSASDLHLPIAGHALPIVHRVCTATLVHMEADQGISDSLRLVGQEVGRYRLTDLIGGGGMGVVYRAEDSRLRRSVALKFLPIGLNRDAESKRRFMHEAWAASALDHPNICTIYEIDESPDGQLFIAMACYEGETLKKKIERGPLPVGEVVDYAIQSAQGLGKAHERGIVHRDIKPANIMVTGDGRVKILDFGLAKLDWAQLTDPGSIVGTVGYMSPEQTRGEVVDHRTDIWSLGVVLYELMTRERPFKGDYEPAMMYSILNEEPAALSEFRGDAPPELEEIVRRCLEKDRDERYSSADALLHALKQLEQNAGTPSGPQRDARHLPRVVVLPFADLSPKRDQEYFCDGLADEIIHALTGIPGLRVVARTTAFAFKNREADVRQIGRMLGVETVLEGGVRLANGRLRITAQLIDVADGYPLWSSQFDRKMDDVFAIQDEISRALTEKLKGELTPGSQSTIVRRSTGDMEAYTYYLKGRFHLHKETPSNLQKANDYFQLAIDKDPKMVAAYVGLADAYVHQSIHDFHVSSPQEAHLRARHALNKALELDDEHAMAHAVLGVLRNLEWDWKGSEDAYQRALELNPNEVATLVYYSWQLGTTGRMEEAIAMLKRAELLDPLWLDVKMLLCLFYSYSRRYEDALQQCRQMIELEPNFPMAYQLRASLHLDKGDYEVALPDYEHALALLGRQPRLLKDMGCLYAAWGRERQATEIADELKAMRTRRFVNPSNIAAIYHKLGERDLMCEWLETACKEHDPWLVTLSMNPFHADIMREPCFQSVLKSMGLENRPPF